MTGPAYVGFTGSRGYPRTELVTNFVTTLADRYPTVGVVSGGRGNVDKTAETTARQLGLYVMSYRPGEKDGHPEVEMWQSENGGEWEFVAWLRGAKSFAQACYFRNEMIVQGSERVVGFWDLSSRGTGHCLKLAGDYGRPSIVYGPDGARVDDGVVAELVAAAVA